MIKRFEIVNKRTNDLIHICNTMFTAELWLKLHIAEINWSCQRDLYKLSDYEIIEKNNDER